jgi:hypothetical protein
MLISPLSLYYSLISLSLPHINPLFSFLSSLSLSLLYYPFFSSIYYSLLSLIYPPLSPCRRRWGSSFFDGKAAVWAADEFVAGGPGWSSG